MKNLGIHKIFTQEEGIRKSIYQTAMFLLVHYFNDLWRVSPPNSTDKCRICAWPTYHMHILIIFIFLFTHFHESNHVKCANTLQQRLEVVCLPNGQQFVLMCDQICCFFNVIIIAIILICLCCFSATTLLSVLPNRDISVSLSIKIEDIYPG